MTEEEMAWDLSQLVQRIDPIFIQKQLQLIQLYKEQGESFVPKFKKLLAARGSKSPRELSAELGLDISEKTFWQRGMRQAEQFVSALEETLTG